MTVTVTGKSHTFVDKFSTAPTMSSRTDATHHFLKLQQPIDESTLPMPRIAEAGRTYKFPFTFVVPDQLLPKACQRYANDQVRAAHLQLPPSMGDKSISGHGSKLLDDLTPEMAKISYAIQVTITRDRETDGKAITLVDKSKKVRIKPAFEEQPPLAVASNDAEYCLRQEKTVRKGLFKGKLGRLVMESQQPRTLRIPGARSDDSRPITTSATVTLRFDPAEEDCMPPKLGCLSSKLKATTFFATTPRRDFPYRENVFLDLSQGVFSETLPLSSRCMSAAQWKKHTPTAADLAASSSPSVSRRDSGISDCSDLSGPSTSKNTPDPSSAYKPGRPFYTATLLIPIELPSTKTFVPTFHTCLISRVYRLNLSLALSATTHLSLKIPLQISADGSAEGTEERREREGSQVALQEADAALMDVFAPRSVAPPLPSQAPLLPPGYEVFSTLVAGRVSRGGVETSISVTA